MGRPAGERSLILEKGFWNWRSVSITPPYFRFVSQVRISGKCTANHAIFLPLEILSISMTYEIRTKSAKSTGSERVGR